MFSADRLQRDTRAIRAGQRDGGQDLPLSDAVPFSNAERMIISACETEIRNAEARYAKESEAHRAQIDALLRSSELNAGHEADRAAARVRQILGEEETDFRSIAEEEVWQRASLETFRVQHNRQLEPIYAISPIKTTGVLMALMVAEAAPNTTFFAEANAHGLLGGFLIALMISAINVLVGFTSGFTAFRYNNHVNRSHRYWSAPTSVILVVGAAKFNLTIGAFRDAIVSAQPSEFGAQLLRFANLLVSFSAEQPKSLESIILIVVGLLIFGFALLKGMRERDAYPGYADRDIQYRLARAAADDKEDAIRRAVGQTVQAFTGRVGEASTATVEMEPVLVSARQSIEAQLEGLHQEKLHFESICNAVIHMYRSANVAARKTAKPAYFAEDVRLAKSYECPLLASVVAALKVLPQKGQVEAVGARADPRFLEGFTRQQYEHVGAWIKRIRDESEARVLAAIEPAQRTTGPINADQTFH